MMERIQEKVAKVKKAKTSHYIYFRRLPGGKPKDKGSMVYYTSGSKGNQFPTSTLMFLRGPVLLPPPPPPHDWLRVSNLFVVYD